MKRIFKILGILLLIIALVAFGGYLYVTQALPDIPLQTELKVDMHPDRVERGRYLANSVCGCMDCHSTRDWDLYAGPSKTGTLGAGGEKFDLTMQFPGEFYAKNITPFALRDWTNAELYRAITSGVSEDGHPLFPVMPYPNYNTLATEDVYSLIAYVRSLDPIVTKPYPESVIDFPVNLIMRTGPEAAQPAPLPKPTEPTYGAYVTNAAACIECHTNAAKGQRIGEPFAGGFAFTFPNGAVLRSPNLTPHMEDGIGAWTKEVFLARFKMYADSSYVPAAVDHEKGEYQTVMPWTIYATMSERDLGAIYDHLHALAPVAGRPVPWTPKKK